MKEKILEAMKFQNMDLLDNLLSINPLYKKLFSQMYQGEEIFLQLALDGDIPIEAFYSAEEGIQRMSDFLYLNNGSEKVLGILDADEDIVINGCYANQTLTKDEQMIAVSLIGKPVEIENQDLLRLMIKLGCREISKTIIYFEKVNTVLIIDAIGGLIWCPDHEFAITCLYEMQKSFTINYRFEDDW